MTDIRNLLLVTYDCARADVAYSGCLPTLERLRQNGVTCQHAISSAPFTSASHATVFTGLQPYHHGIRHLFREQLRPDQLTLAYHLRQSGFQTGAVVSCPSLSGWFGFGRGFQSFNDELPRIAKGREVLASGEVQQRNVTMKRAQAVADYGIQWLSRRKADKRWFMFLHFFDAHWPYDPPPSEVPARNSYEGELQYLDSQLARVVEFLSERQQLDKTLVVVFGDHGEDLEGLYPNDKAGEALGHPEEKGHGCLLYEQTQHVPLVFSHPSLPPHTLKESVGLVDVSPTVCSLLGVEPMHPVDGANFAPALFRQSPPPPRSFYAETQYPEEMSEATGTFFDIRNKQALWVGEHYKVIRPWGDDTQAQLFNLAEDPLEMNPLPPSALPFKLELQWPQEASGLVG